MKAGKFVFFGIIGFVILNLYTNYVPFSARTNPEGLISKILTENAIFWILFWLAFFPLTVMVSRLFLKQKRFILPGLNKNLMWKNQLGLGLAIGIIFKLFLCILYFYFGKFQVEGLNELSNLPLILLFGSLIAIFSLSLK